MVDGAERLREGGPVEVREPGSGRGSGNVQGPGPGQEHKQGGKPRKGRTNESEKTLSTKNTKFHEGKQQNTVFLIVFEMGNNLFCSSI